MIHRNTHHRPIINQAENFVVNNLSQSFTIREVASACAVSYSHFNDLFTSFQQEPFWQYVKRKRLEHAAGLLRHSGHTIADIGELSGYGTKYSFSKAFTSHFSISAKTYRKLTTLPEQNRTLQVVKLFSKLDAGKLWEEQQPQRIKLPDLKLYYTIPPKNKPVEDYVQDINFIRGSLQQRISSTDTFVRVVTGTHDAVPATSYEKLKAYFGIVIPQDHATGEDHVVCYDSLAERTIPGGNYLRLDLPMDCMTAGLIAYSFIDQGTARGYFKLAGNHFFIALLDDFHSECYVPLY